MSQYESEQSYWVHVPDQVKLKLIYLTVEDFANFKAMLAFLEEIGPYHPTAPLPDGTPRWTVKFGRVRLLYTVIGYNVHVLDIAW